MSLRYRYAPACGSKVVSFRWLTQPLSLSTLFFENRASGTDWARLCRACGALCMGSPGKLWLNWNCGNNCSR